MNFKEILKNDVKATFLNAEEFAETHTLNGAEVCAVLDDDLLDGEINVSFHGQGAQERAGGLYSGGVALYVSTDDFGKPKVGTGLKLDGRQYTVLAVSEQDGMYKINLQRTGAR
jgi:hypothetical protein